MSETKKKCLIIVNRRSGNSSRLNRKELSNQFGKDYRITFRFIEKSDDKWSSEGFDRLVICGGDGTLNNALNNIKGQNVEVFYYPCGTLNEFSKTIKQKGHCVINDAGIINSRIFSYVAATGTFTPLGYVVKEKLKKRLKIFAYIARVIKEFKVYNIAAEISSDSDNYKGNYALIMVVDSKRCFGFRFNRLYKPNDDMLHLLLIKSPGKDSFINRVKMFFPFFRAFFIGFSKPYNSKNITFIPIKFIQIQLESEQIFCVDGEKVCEKDNVEIKLTKLDSQITIINKIICKPNRH